MKKKVHFLGIGGIGMSALAHILLEKKEQVSGYDKNLSPLLKQLAKKGALISKEPPLEFDIVYSSAFHEEHPDLKKAKKRGLSIYHRSQLLKELMEEKRRILVGGTHGKTSTSALLTWVLIFSGRAPSYAVGGILKNTEKNGGHGEGKLFVAEADESDGSFLKYQSEYAILTNVEREHLDFWKTEEQLINGFEIFANQTGSLLWCLDDPLLARLNLPGQTYGRAESADWHLCNVEQQEERLLFSIVHQKSRFEKITLPLIGEYQALNACAVWAMAHRLGISEKEVRAAFKTFKGIRRRLEKKGEISGVTLYDDYAHHPTEIRLMLHSLRKAIGFDKRLIAIFQPHRYLRTRDFLDSLVDSFHAADFVYITEVYSAGERPIKAITGRALSKLIPNSLFLDHLPSFKRGDVVVTIGAGSITQLSKTILEKLR